MSYNGKVWSVSTGIANETIEQRLVDFELPKEVMEKLYIPIDGKVYISNGSGHTAILKLDNSSGGRELEMGLRIDGQTPPTDWWDKGSDKVQRTIKFKAEVSANSFFCPDFSDRRFLRTTGFKSRSGTTFRAVFTFLEWAENGPIKSLSI